ncbi:MAG: class I SAM-dependent methyltransferase, partial [Bacillota bacterium]
VVEGWVDVTNVQDSLVSFRWTYVFESDGAIITSDSTLRFRSLKEITKSLRDVGLSVEDVREAPDRPGREYVFIARRPTA